MDEDERMLAAMPSLDDRMKYHTKRLRSIAYTQGVEGIAAYKERHTEARPLRVNPGNPSVSRSKPAGYDEYLANLAIQWLSSDTALACTNTADVERMNAHFATTRFNPAKQFSLALGKRAKEAIRQAFAAQGVALDTVSIGTMSDVRKAAKAVRARTAPSARPFGKVGTMSGDILTIGNKAHRIERHKDRECIRVTADGVTQRVYLSTLRVILGSVGEDDPLSYSSIEDMGELAPGPSRARNHPGHLETGTSSPEISPHSGAAAPVSLAERIAALKAHCTAYAADPDADPLILNSNIKDDN